jgi:hypothetical protein
LFNKILILTGDWIPPVAQANVADKRRGEFCMNNRKKLPTGISTFREIRESGYYYVDKSGFAVQLADHGKYYFLSRPRRFGKSLLVDTFSELFAGSRELFTGLHAENNWNWSIKYPVLKFSFAGGGAGEEALQETLSRQLGLNEKKWGLKPAVQGPGNRFADLILKAHEKTGQKVVILVDEYDKPILDAIANRDVALKNRDTLRDFYSVIKDNDAHIRFAFLTGVSRFSKAGIFSGLNNLMDITIDERYSALCGYTENDLDQVFAPELEGVDREEVRKWYNGYNWTGERVYNPYDILLYFSTRKFASYWFETGTPTFLVKLLMEREVFTPDLNQTVASEMLISTFDVDTMPVEALLFQTGYLTLLDSRRIGARTEFCLGYPNLEVQSALNDVLLKSLMNDASRAEAGMSRLFDALTSSRQVGNFTALDAHFKALFASIPHDWHRKNNIAGYEGFYASVFYSHFAALGLDIRVEDATSHGRVDMTVLFQNQALIFEFKVVGLDKTPGTALEQIQKKGYAEKYQGQNLEIYLIGVEFDRGERNIVRFDWEKSDSSHKEKI